ncbi:MAG TPA: neutral zinc metallopeptidase [Chloroflexia bacterium]|nr:neutral zinc metallopeptidase [Chloroflexia bacterium]
MATANRHRKLRWVSAVMMAALSFLAFRPTASYAQAAPTAYGHFFQETHQAASGAFWQYWTSHGGLEQQGYPLSEEFTEVSDTNGKEYLVQYYERAVFEYHPETPNTIVLLSLLGRFEYQKKYPSGAPNQKPNTTTGSVLFKETGKRLGGKFRTYWNTHGGLAQQGFPISDEFQEKSPIDGKTYTVQYFERAVFELHPELAGTKFEVLLSQLGRFRYEENDQSRLEGSPGDIDGDGVPDAEMDVDGDGILDGPDDCPRFLENVNKVFDLDGCPDTMQTLLVFAAEDIDTYWAGFFDDEGIDYAPPDIFAAYWEDGQYDTECGPVEVNNAFYCGGDHGIYYDYNFLQSELDEVGDFAPVIILAHEWGHLIQGNLGILDDPHYLTFQTEQQADCFAGAWSWHVEDEGLLEEGDLDEAASSLFRAGDEEDFPWFEPGAHGSPQQRIQAFQLGYDEGPYACFDFTP